jgi:N-acetylglutamate synthase-like GNAT family acetyltransferase
MERIAVHPAYWRRGHGSTIARWGMQLADTDGVDQGVFATSMGASLFSHLGFDRIDEIQIPEDHDGKDGFTIAVLKYTANH